jgi:hypothetical protein
VREHILSVGKLGKATLTDVTGIPAPALLLALAVAALAGFWFLEARSGERGLQ